MKIDTEENYENYKKSSAGSRFRKTKKFIGVHGSNSFHNKYQPKSKSHQKTVNEDMMNLSAAFTELKRRNVSFLS